MYIPTPLNMTYIIDELHTNNQSLFTPGIDYYDADKDVQLAGKDAVIAALKKPLALQDEAYIANKAPQIAKPCCFYNILLF